MGWALGAGLVVLILALRGSGSAQTPWTGEGLPTPLGGNDELYHLARRTAEAIRLAGPTGARPQILELQRRAALVRMDEASQIATASGLYDARTRQATGYYGRLWQEETP